MPRSTDTPVDIRAAHGGPAGFLSAEDFDVTGILAGLEPCASRYWWIPELHAAPLSAPPAADVAAPQAAPVAARHQAARRPASRSGTAAA